MVTSRSRRSDALRSTVAASPSPGSSSSVFSSIKDRASHLFSGKTKEDASERSAGVYSTPSKGNAKRSYGFATSNLSHFSDQNSEDLYRYKNISSDYMRETSPTRDEDEPSNIPSSNRFAPRRNNDDDDQRIRKSNTGRSGAMRKDDDDDRQARASNTGRFAAGRNNDDDDQQLRKTNTGRFRPMRKDDDQSKTVRNPNQLGTEKNDDHDDDNDVVTQF